MLMMKIMLTKLMRKALLGDSDEHKKATCNWVLNITGSYYVAFAHCQEEGWGFSYYTPLGLPSKFNKILY